MTNCFGYENTLDIEIVKKTKEKGSFILYDRTHSFLMEDEEYRELADYSFASAKRKDISEDYAGHLSLKGKSFWAKMCVFKTFLENRELYPNEMHDLYPFWYYRIDLLLLNKILLRRKHK